MPLNRRFIGYSRPRTQTIMVSLELVLRSTLLWPLPHFIFIVFLLPAFVEWNNQFHSKASRFSSFQAFYLFREWTLVWLKIRRVRLIYWINVLPIEVEHSISVTVYFIWFIKVMWQIGFVTSWNDARIVLFCIKWWKRRNLFTLWFQGIDKVYYFCVPI